MYNYLNWISFSKGSDIIDISNFKINKKSNNSVFLDFNKQENIDFLYDVFPNNDEIVFFEKTNYSSNFEILKELEKIDENKIIFLNLNDTNNKDLLFFSHLKNKNIIFSGYFISNVVSSPFPIYSLIEDIDYILPINLYSVNCIEDNDSYINNILYYVRKNCTSVSVLSSIKNISFLFNDIKKNFLIDEKFSFSFDNIFLQESYQIKRSYVEAISIICYNLLFSGKKAFSMHHIEDLNDNFCLPYKKIKRILKANNLIFDSKEFFNLMKNFEKYFCNYNSIYYINDKHFISFYASQYMATMKTNDIINIIRKNCFTNNHFEERFISFLRGVITFSEVTLDSIFENKNLTINIEYLNRNQIPTIIDSNRNFKKEISMKIDMFFNFENYFNEDYYLNFVIFFDEKYKKYQQAANLKIHDVENIYYRFLYYLIDCPYEDYEEYNKMYNDEFIHHMIIFYIQFRKDQIEFLEKLNKKELKIYNELKIRQINPIDTLDSFRKEEYLKTFKNNTDKFQDFLNILDIINEDDFKTSFMIENCLNVKNNQVLRGKNKGENHISKHLKNILKNKYGINSIREEELNDENRMDLSISDSFENEFFIVEAKGFWNKELVDLKLNNIENQLLHYLKETGQTNAVYLVYSYDYKLFDHNEHKDIKGKLDKYEKIKYKIKEKIDVINKKNNVCIVFKELKFQLKN